MWMKYVGLDFPRSYPPTAGCLTASVPIMKPHDYSIISVFVQIRPYFNLISEVSSWTFTQLDYEG